MAFSIIGTLGVLLSLPCWLFFIKGAVQLTRIIRAGGTPVFPRTDEKLSRFATLVRQVLSHERLATKRGIAIAHWCVMMGFIFGSIVWFEAYIQTFNPHGGWPLIGHTKAYQLIEELLALATIAGIAILVVKRQRHPERFVGSNRTAAYFVEAVVFLEAVGMLLVKAAKAAIEGRSWTDLVSGPLSELLPASPVLVSIFALVKLLTGMIWLLIVGQQLQWGVAWHRFLAFFNLYFQRNPDGKPALGAFPPVDLEGLKQLGITDISHLSWKQRLDVASCTECGRCQEVCPAWNTAKPLSPKLLITSLRDSVEKGIPLNVTEDILYSCTNCGACVQACPVQIEHLDLVADLRRGKVLEEAEFPEELGGLFKNLETKGNPWGRNKRDRALWITQARTAGLHVPILGHDVSADEVEFVLWVGCAGAFGDNGQKTTRALVELLSVAGVSYAVLGTAETCTGDPARRAGNEFLYQALATENIEMFAATGADQKTMITTCAHCFNTLKNEYPQLGGVYSVIHYSQLLGMLVRRGLLKPIPRGENPDARPAITYHDPCFLGRHNGVFDPPRELLSMVGNFKELPRHAENAFCCGAGGSRMFMEEKLGTRISDNRATEVVASGATTLAVGCPYCNTMLTSGIKAVAPESGIEVKDIAQVVRDNLLDSDGNLPPNQPPRFLELPIMSVKQRAKMAANKPAKPEAAEAAAKPEQPTSGAAPQDSGKDEAAAVAAPAQPAAPGVPAPKAGAPVPGAGIPVPAASVPKPAAPAVPAPKPAGSVPTPHVPSPGVPTPAAPKAGVPTPSVPAAGVPTPGGASVPKPAGSVPTPAIPTPGAPASGTAKPGVPVPGGTKPAVPTPEAGVPKPAAPAPGVPTPSVPSPGVPTPGVPTPKPAATVPAPGVPTPGVPKPAVPTPAAPATPVPAPPAAKPAVPTPGAGVPKPGVPVPGVPKPAGQIPAPVTGIPKPKQPAQD